VSRREFRVAQDCPRPPSAVVMVASATLTLAITGQVSPFALGIAAVAIGLAALWREEPRSFQRSALLLNVALAVITAISVAMWMRGELALIALSHFAILTSGLQLLDSRPRRAEFLLVALSLFQVVLAANLTDSMWFPPLLTVFAITTVWTLMVHTLRAEALEAGEPAAARRVLTTQLYTLTGVASVVTVVIALVVFPLLPRVRSGAFLSGGFGGSMGVSGFSDRVELGDIGRIRMDPQVALRVETLAGNPPAAPEAYWRGLALDAFDGRSWSVTPPDRERVPGFGELGLALASRRPGVRLEQRIVREPVTSGVLFSSGAALRLQGSVGGVERDVNGGFYAFRTAQDRVSYDVITAPEVPAESDLRADRAREPHGADGRFLALPPLAPEIAALARRITANASTDAERARALEVHLQSAGRYTDSPPDHSRGGSPVESFLLNQTEGHCEYFASGMVVLARSIDLPARIVNGFAGGEVNSIGGFVEVRRSDAHTWVEIHYEDAGWVRYDPTPTDLRLAGASRLSARDQWGDLQSALEYWWFKNVIDFDRSRQALALRGAWLAWRNWRNPVEQPAGERAPAAGGSKFGFGPGAQLALPAALAIAVFLLWRARGTSREPVPPYYRDALRLVARRGGPRRGPATTARGFADEAAETLPSAAAETFRQVTDLYLAERFGGHTHSSAGRRAVLDLRSQLSRGAAA